MTNLAWKTPCHCKDVVSDGGLEAGRGLAGSMSRGERAGLGFEEVSAQHVLVHDNGGGLVGHCCGCVAAARSCCSRVCAENTAMDAQERAMCSVSGVQAASGVEVQDYV